MRCDRIVRWLMGVGLGLLGLTATVQAQSVVYHDTPLRQVLDDVARRTGYQVLYRDALVSGRTVTLATSTSELLKALTRELSRQGLVLEADTVRRQLILREAPSRSVSIEGQVRDRTTGMPLPYATVSWWAGDQLLGTMADADGHFSLTLQRAAAQDTLALTASYVGYRPQTVRLAVRDKQESLTIFLQHQDKKLPTVLIVGSAAWLDGIDTTWQRLVQPERFAPFGERGVLRALQALPAVGLAVGLEGLTVRGSQTDGFQVLLDGVPVYHPSHLFGLFDAFNPDALQAVGFFYDVAPATYAAPPGGTLAFVTRSGAYQRLGGVAGLSNVAGRLLLEGPLGRSGSWLLAGRRSLLDVLAWPGNDRLVAFGLDVARPTGPLPPNVADLEARLLELGPSTATFYDVHGKLRLESRRVRLTVSGYLGSDDARQQAQRLMPRWNARGRIIGFEWQPVTTWQRWTNRTASIQLTYQMAAGFHLRTLLATTAYASRYAKDDFLYAFAGGGLQKLFRRLAPFAYANALREWRWEQTLQIVQGTGYWTLGYALQQLTLTYEEHSAVRARPFQEKQQAVQTDAFLQYEGRPDPLLNVLAGLRLHAFSTGPYFRLSPRLQLTVHPDGRWSAGVGFSRNYQFRHHLAFENMNSTGVWLLTGRDQPPTVVDNVSVGVQLRPGHTRIQLDAYVRRFANVWQHEVVAPFFLIARDPETTTPWLTGARSRAYGLEMLLDQPLGPFRATLAYALARVELAHDALNGGAWYPAPWDRRHQFRAYLDVPLWSAAALTLAWFSASGPPNTERYTEQTQPERLGPYHRMDLTLTSRYRLAFATAEMRLGVFNLFNRANPWYREPVLVLVGERLPRRFAFAPVDVYDLGRQASFELVLHF
ncbi:TonB-dependent receptor [Rhodothermus profundi]|uniref:Outer membrane receptor proteins, mostly Fe transport n=1 Tax=Rhodothermus profundi TaxID=633813 RepID=A0A1M6TJW5_9BACT|nr:TonB-dependent receptor [Rhodothermus profundi]SHK57203.1 Outer membrane receptor proteins, mostly Fe transport [Rhodothermus profundi]